MQYLGPCEACGKLNRNYRALAAHLRQRPDAAHQDLSSRWHQWRSKYRATLRCRKCGQLWEISDKSDHENKRCPKCENLRQTLGKRRYERLKFDMAPDTRQVMTESGTKAGWDGLKDRHITWTMGDDLTWKVFEAFEAGQLVTKTIHDLGITYRIYVDILSAIMGADEYKVAHRRRKEVVGATNVQQAHAKWAAMSSDDKAAYFQKHFGKGSALEASLADALRQVGLTDLVLNVWQSLRVGSQLCPREADIKIAVGDGRKVVVLCDGEAFHGPRFIYGPPAARIADDVATAEAYFDAGYSVFRYSETEIHSGWALKHLVDALARLKSGTTKLYRTWYPPEERAA